MTAQKRDEIAEALTRARRGTLAIFDLASEEDLHQSPGFGYRPIIWHLAHIGVFEAYWILQQMKDEPAPDERYQRIFDPIHTPREESKDLPTRKEMENYLSRVRDSVLSYLDGADFDGDNPLLKDAYVFHLVLEHEYQHQETLLYLLNLLDPKKKTRPDLLQKISTPQPAPHANELITIPAGSFEMGGHHNFFSYDNEYPAHTINLPAFKIDRLLTTNEEYAEFIEEGGYARREFWSAEGWAWRGKENTTRPLSWVNADGKLWRVRTLFDDGRIEPRHPVTGISWYEAEAYARFRGKRLPTEAEWEKAASWDGEHERKRRFSWGDEEPTDERANFGTHFWGTSRVGSFPQGASFYGLLDTTGNVWEWTNDAFAGYEGFKSFPYPEYSEIWFDGDHRVLKGGSWATRAPLLRTSFRNFFRRHFRIAFAGLRCAADV